MTNLISLNNKKKIHFIGIGGISMSGLAEIAYTRGFAVTGSDMKSSHTTSHLESLNIPVYYGHAASNIEKDVDLVVYTAAIHADNPEIQAAKAANIELVTRSKFLGLIMKDYEFPICIAGTHGKTTTTSMLTHGLLAANLDPTITVGGILNAIHGNIRIGHTKYFATEACEYCNSFLDFFPKVGIILNIEEDHLDFFKDINDIRHSFQKFASTIPTNGFLAINGATPDLDTFTAPLHCKIETFGLDESYNWYAKNITFDEKACANFDVYYNSNFMINLKLHVTGTHNILNALSVCSVYHFLGLDLNTLNEGLKEFTGADQRFEIKGKFNDITVVDDYAHHPTEIAATLEVANNYPHNHLYIVFQPHTYTRTRAFLNDFAKVLQNAENVIVTDIYAAREKDPGDISSKDIVDLINAHGKGAIYMKDFNDIANHLKSKANAGDVIITMGAGNVNQIADILLG
ncbi:UDP-N-acetylmuramate--L-alanine ligase [Cellulosilyticum ruminicola]|uniref:UDP-N-acetylmuramate--L-alanine ligase n=1 Tax=Cellulosilyticum ruminicola TaxID=425254 RepID=UPI0006D070B5|nr:UDP-N-acetylmuramate--L-alanine ligase [Cellulosilyticum ruminicola]